jgi:putative glycosyltransferase (TIGR04348 family)
VRICLVTPAPRGARKGNRVTGNRWARLLRELGHDVSVATEFTNQRCDLLIALHALHSAPSVERWRERRPDAPLILSLTGTDLYRDIKHSAEAQHALELASRLVVLQPLGVEELPVSMRRKAHVIFQSATPPPGRWTPKRNAFEVTVIANLREVKDPLRAARASRLLPASSSLRVIHIGSPLDEALERVALRENASNSRYEYRGELPRWKAMRILARSRLLALTSRLEGGANVVSEAIACSVPVVSSHIAGSVGLLGAEYPGYYEIGDTQGLAQLLGRVEAEPALYKDLEARCSSLRPLVDPAQELRRWASLIDDLR